MNGPLGALLICCTNLATLNNVCTVRVIIKYQQRINCSRIDNWTTKNLGVTCYELQTSKATK